MRFRFDGEQEESMASVAFNIDVSHELTARGFAWIPQASWMITSFLQANWRRMWQDWDQLELDRYLKNGATFRRRRYGRFSWLPTSKELAPLAPEPYFQPEAENSYAGGVEREFAPLLKDTAQNPFLHAIVSSTFACLPLTADQRRTNWEVRIHQIRIIATPDEPGLPAPEGIHQDGTDFLTLHLVRRRNIGGGETRIYDLNGQVIGIHTMREPLDSLILEDPRIMHGVTPVYSADCTTPGTRDLLGVDFIHRPGLLRPVKSQ
jgi:hypothetical protein